jgi:uncharacterized repeat protein (TIGR01451 family)
MTLGGGFRCYYDYLSPIPIIFSFGFTTIPGDVTLSLNTATTNIDGFSSITSIGGKFEFYASDGINSITGLQNLQSVGGTFNMALINLTDISPLSSLTSTGGLSLNLPVNSLEGLNNLTTISQQLSLNCPQLNDISALENLSSIGSFAINNSKLTNFNSLQNVNIPDTDIYNYIIITENSLLADISALEHINPDAINYLKINNNPLLSSCSISNICTFVSANIPNSIDINNNGSGCSSVDQITQACNPDYNTIWGTIKYNYNNNNCGSFTQNAAGIKVKAVSSIGTEYVTYSQQDGTYDIYVPEGTYTTQAEINNADFTVGTDPVETAFTGMSNNENIDFCISPAQIVDDIRVSVFPLVSPRPGFDAIYKIECKNVGSIVKSGTVTFTFDPSKQTFILGVPGNAVVTDNTVTFTYEGLYPLHSEYFSVRFNVLAPPANNIGEVLAYTATVTPVAGDATPENNTVVFNQTLIGSYDPNDKTVMEGDKVLIENAGDYLTYRIRFQNTGTASAIFVRLEDELDTKLEWNTFEPVSASHDNYRIELIDGFLKVYFDNINLAAEADNEPASHGYFMYKIKSKDTVVLGDIISNTASIYFDFNTPIVTNTVTTEYIEETAGLTSPGFSVALYPNPAKTVINFGSGLAITEATLYNSLGQQVIKTTGTDLQNVNVSSLANGVYLCQVKNASGDIAAKKIIISK